jgi:hypothetical protein
MKVMVGYPGAPLARGLKERGEQLLLIFFQGRSQVAPQERLPYPPKLALGFLAPAKPQSKPIRTVSQPRHVYKSTGIPTFSQVKAHLREKIVPIGLEGKERVALTAVIRQGKGYGGPYTTQGVVSHSRITHKDPAFFFPCKLIRTKPLPGIYRKSVR